MTHASTDGPGAIRVREGFVDLNTGSEQRTLVVENTGDRPIQVGSHFQFADVNPALAFDRGLARGYRLDIPSGTSVRFEPGASREVGIVALGGRRHVPGLQLGKPASPGVEED